MREWRTRRGLRTFAAVLALAAATSCGTDTVAAPRARPVALPPLAAGTLAIVGANILPMDHDVVLRDRTVVVRDGRIVAIGPAAETSVPAEATRVDAAGAYLLPGLIDAHVHLRRDDVPAYVAAGVTTVRNMWGTPGVAALRAEAAVPGALLPTILSAGPGLDGSPASWPYTRVVESPAAAVAAVDDVATEGWEYVKVYNRLAPDVYDAVVARARSLGLPVVGHVPFALDARRAMASGQRSIEHLTGYPRLLTGTPTVFGWASADPRDFAAVAAESARSGTWNCPTLAVVEVTTAGVAEPERGLILENRRRFVKALYDAGAPIVAGTDAGIDLVAPGTSLVDELQRLVGAGIPPYAALRAATADAARFLAVDGELGTVAVGRRADLVLVTADPRADLDALRRPAGVVLRGAWLPASAAGSGDAR